MERMTKKPPWVRNPEKWACPKCGSRNLTGSVIWTCRNCGCRKSYEAFATWFATEGTDNGNEG